MRILVTGATGLLGLDIAKIFSAHHEVIGWARHTKSFPAPLDSVDVTDEKKVAEGLERLRPDLVFHCAAVSNVDVCQTDPELAFRSNRDAVSFIAKGCAKVGAFLVAISTDYVFSGQQNRPHREEDPTGPVNVYGKAKLEGEKKALSETKRSLVVRVSGLFGLARSNLATQMIENFRDGKPVLAVANQRFSPSYTVDIAEGLFNLIKHLEVAPRVLHLANAGGGTRLEVAQNIAKDLRFPPSLITPTTWRELQRPAPRPVNSELDGSLFKKLTGFSLRPWQEALACLCRETSRNLS